MTQTIPYKLFRVSIVPLAGLEDELNRINDVMDYSVIDMVAGDAGRVGVVYIDSKALPKQPWSPFFDVTGPDDDDIKN